MTEKQCSYCKVVKQFTDFTARRDGKFGLQSRCRPCGSKTSVERMNARTPEQKAAARERIRVYERTNEGAKAKRAEWIANNRDRVRAIKAKYRAENREQLALTQKERWAANPDARRQTVAKYQKANPDKTRAAVIKRRATRKNATTNWDAELDALVCTEAAALAIQRKAIFGFGWDVDHIVPLAGHTVCGLHNAYNLAVVPSRFNQSKSNRILPPLAWLGGSRP